jgi:hypothetical protein
MKADAAARREDIKAKIEKRADQLDAKAAATDADWAEQDAADALDYAVYVIYDAQLAVLDALDARAYADERARSPVPRVLPVARSTGTPRFPGQSPHDQHRHHRRSRRIDGGQRSGRPTQRQCPAACPPSMCSVSP